MAQTWPAARLTATETGELDLARTHLRALVAAADALVAAAGHDPDLADCRQAGCGLAEVEHGQRLCALAHRLALLDLEDPTAADALLRSPSESGRSQDGGVAAAEGAFRTALVESLDAVRACRSVWHREGRCAFAHGADIDGCGEVLRAAHLAG